MLHLRGRGRDSLLAGGLLLAGALAVAACGGSGDTPRLDVRPALTLPDSVPLGEPLDMRWSWTPGPDFTAPAEDYKIFVHMVDPQGNIVQQDDHFPPEPTSQWTAGAPIEYQRWLYVPELEVEYVDIVVGLYERDNRAEIQGPGGWSDSVTVHRLSIRADDMTGIPVYMSGWHPLEQVADQEPSSWRWTEDVAKAVFTNPMKDAVLHLSAHGPFDEVGPQTLVVKIGEQELATIEITDPTNFMERIEVPAAVMGDGEWVELTLEVSPALVPKELDPESQDDRRLGLQVFMLYLSSS
jgi:hypothetical protein